MQTLESETVLFDLHPHWFLSFKETWAFVPYVVLGLLFWLAEDKLSLFIEGAMSFFPVLTPVLKFLNSLPRVVLAYGLLLIHSLILSLIKIRPKVLLIHCICLFGVYGSATALPEVADLEFRLLILIGILGILFTVLSLNHTRYIITNLRIIIRSGFLGGSERTFFINRIQDLVLQRSLLGRFFGFGTIVPITASQLGMGNMGSNASMAAGAGIGPVAAGGSVGFSQSRNTVAPSEEFCLYCIPSPKRVYTEILKNIQPLAL